MNFIKLLYYFKYYTLKSTKSSIILVKLLKSFSQVHVKSSQTGLPSSGRYVKCVKARSIVLLQTSLDTMTLTRLDMIRMNAPGLTIWILARQRVLNLLWVEYYSFFVKKYFTTRSWSVTRRNGLFVFFLRWDLNNV